MAGLGEIPPGTDLTGMPAAEPPPGIDANFVDPENRGPAYIAVSAVCMALALSFVLVRLWTRLFVLKNPWWDDCEYPNVRREMRRLTRQQLYL